MKRVDKVISKNNKNIAIETENNNKMEENTNKQEEKTNNLEGVSNKTENINNNNTIEMTNNILRNIETIIIPSVYESAPVNLDKVLGKDLHKRLKIEENGEYYIVGDLALEEGTMPHKNINSFVGDLDYNLMMKSALLVASSKIMSGLKVSTGFPYATFKINRQSALDYLAGEHLIKHDSSTYSNGVVKSRIVDVRSAYVIPEVVASAIAIRKLANIDNSFMVLSIGFGTLETTLSTPNEQIGLQRSSNSSFGLIYAINALKNELSDIYSSMANDSYWDKAMQDGYIFLNRRRIDIRDARRRVLTAYYKNIISPMLFKSFSDKDFAISSGLYLSGGGALYNELIECFREEFEGIINIVVLDDPNLLAAKGYLFNSEIQGKDYADAVGIDVGNSSTVICTYSHSK
jgi:plasmid segregation protein ParM